MTSKERLLLALRNEVPDRLPATVHQWQEYHLKKHLGGLDPLAAFRRFGLDASLTCMPLIEPETTDWRPVVETTDLGNGRTRLLVTISTPGGTLSYSVERDEVTAWTREHLVKSPEDVDLLRKYMPVPRLDHRRLADEYERLGDDGIMRGLLIGNQGGCWQDACELFGLEKLIVATYEDPAWVHHFLGVVQDRKLRYISDSLSGAR